MKVDGHHRLAYTGTAYELTTEVNWSQLEGAGVQLHRSADGSRHVDAGVYGSYAFVNRRACPNPDASGAWQESRTPLPAGAKSVTLRILVDRTTVEMFVDDGRHTHSMETFPHLVDTGLALFTIGGRAVFKNTVIREFAGVPRG